MAPVMAPGSVGVAASVGMGAGDATPLPMKELYLPCSGPALGPRNVCERLARTLATLAPWPARKSGECCREGAWKHVHLEQHWICLRKWTGDSGRGRDG